MHEERIPPHLPHHADALHGEEDAELHGVDGEARLGAHGDDPVALAIHRPGVDVQDGQHGIKPE